MKQFDYIIKDSLGIHARPAGLLVKTAGKFKSSVKLICNEKSADAKKLFAVMGLGVKHNSSVTVKADGSDEDEAIAELKNFFENNL
ncbi:MAG: HPr family phosphocarrier protein [Oscillospiraceae bacterium]|nr:HPr family phosphocarrier protein [Oscillospiraceae bacterium]